MPLLGAGWISGYTVTKLFRRLGHLKWYSAYESPVASKELVFSTLRAPDTGCKKAMNDVSLKPPNVLIYCGRRDADNKIFSCVKETLLQVLNLHSYSIYCLHETQVNTQPWMENTALLVIAHHDSPPSQPIIQKQFVQYLRSGGKILSLCSSFTFHSVKYPWEDKFKPFITSVQLSHPGCRHQTSENVWVVCEPFYFKGDHTVILQDVNTRKPVAIKITEGDGSAVLSLVHLEFISSEPVSQNQELAVVGANKWRQSKDARLWILSHILQLLGITCQPGNAPELTPMYLLARKLDEQKLLQSLRPSLENGICKGKDLSLHFVSSERPIPKTSETLLPVITGDQNSQSVSFDWTKYLECLQTKVLGHILLYAEVITSTQTVLDGNYKFVQTIPNDLGIIIVAGQQMKGQGRGGNTWLSPSGCMMFSLHVQIPFASNLGQRPPYLQHIASLAAIEAIRSQPGYEGIDVSLKWPNDIYFGHEVKIGGVIVTSSAAGDTLSAVIGVGVNLANREPTISINEIISLYNKDHQTFLQPLSIEETMARTVNNIETLVDDFQNNGVGPFLEKYYNRWLHSNAKVKLCVTDTPEDVTITGLDHFGFLLVETKSGNTLSVQPDGNSFDMLKNLITIKK